jgi:hypothetical protein
VVRDRAVVAVAKRGGPATHPPAERTPSTAQSLVADPAIRVGVVGVLAALGRVVPRRPRGIAVPTGDPVVAAAAPHVGGDERLGAGPRRHTSFEFGPAPDPTESPTVTYGRMDRSHDHGHAGPAAPPNGADRRYRRRIQPAPCRRSRNPSAAAYRATSDTSTTSSATTRIRRRWMIPRARAACRRSSSVDPGNS